MSRNPSELARAFLIGTWESHSVPLHHLNTIIHLNRGRTSSKANTFSINYGARRVQGLYGSITELGDIGEMPRGIDAVRVGRPITTGGLLANRSSATVG
jgi:hypothetical protein